MIFTDLIICLKKKKKKECDNFINISSQLLTELFLDIASRHKIRFGPTFCVGTLMYLKQKIDTLSEIIQNPTETFLKEAR